VSLAKTSDVVLFIGGLNKNHEQDSEGGDRLEYNLPFNQDQLLTEILKVNKKVVVVLVSGNAVAMPWINEVPAVLQAWHLGSEAGNALASVITGDVNPSGKLPFTFPVKLTDNGAHFFGEISYPGINKTQEYKEDILVGYRWHDTKKITPLFAFGHGLSYTSFEYGKITTDKTSYAENEVAKLTFTITNTGSVKGAEAAQVYISDIKSSVLRPLKELKAFSKVMLEPGESKKVEIDLPIKDWAFFNDKTQKWEIEPGKFNILLGASSADIRQKLTVSVN
jgi:beta-glucosidase